MEALHRKEEFPLRGVLDLHDLALGLTERDALQATEDADAVIDVDDVVADLEVAKVREERVARPSLRRQFSLGRRVEEVPLRDDRELRRLELEAGGERPARDRESLAGRGRIVFVRNRELAKQTLGLLAPAARGDEEDRAIPGLARALELRTSSRPESETCIDESASGAASTQA